MIFLVLLDIVYILARWPLWFARDIFYIYSSVYTFLKYNNCCIKNDIYSFYKHNGTCEKKQDTYKYSIWSIFTLFISKFSMQWANIYWWGVIWVLDSLSLFWSSLVLKLHRCTVLVHQSNVSLYLVSYLLMVW